MTIYKNAGLRRGFADRCARQLEVFLQSGVAPEDLRDCAQESTGAARMKLLDLAAILEKYVQLTQGRYQDGEQELVEATSRVSRADFIKSGRFWFFGFDITPPTLTRLMAEIAAVCPESALFFPLPNDKTVRDYDCYRPLEQALGRLAGACQEAGARMHRTPLPKDEGREEIGALERELFAYPVKIWNKRPEHVHLAFARDVRQECMLAAATARRLAIEGMRYGEMQLICPDMEGYRQSLIEAFELYEIPLFLENSRPASRMATAECLLTALRMVERNFRSEDVFALMRCGYMDLSRDEADRLTNYAVRRGIDGGRWLRTLNRGNAAEIAEMEPLRERLMTPVIQLKEDLKAAQNLREQLAALFQFLMRIGAYERSQEHQQELINRGLREAAGVLAQSWNRIIGAMDQMAELMDGGKLGLRELTQTLAESLEAAVLKPLPQSGDAVYAQSAGRILMQPAKALFVLGLTDRSTGAEDALLTPGQRHLVAQKTKAYLGPDEADAARLRRFYLKAALGMATEKIFFSCPMSGNDGSACRAGLELELIRQIFPDLEPLDEACMDELLCSAPRAALGSAARALASRWEGERPRVADVAAATALREVADQLPQVGGLLNRMETLLQGEEEREAVDVESARRLYGRLQAQSVTSLERFARCPFSYFVRYGLRPERVEPFEFDRREAGSFLHEAVNAFLRSCSRELNNLSDEEARQRMGRIVDGMLEGLKVGTPMEDSFSARAQQRTLRATACRCAQVLCAHMRGSAFHAEALERSFGREDGKNQLRVGDTVLEGRIDRMDLWEEGNCLRVIDFKLGGRPLNLAGAYYGLELQLPVYLGAALKQRHARSAGVYYFALDEGIVNTQSVDPIQVERERSERFRMSGLLPQDPELIRAQTPHPEEVFQGRLTGEGKPYANVPCADDVNFERLVRHVLKRASEQLERIRAGAADISPASFDGREACALCDYRSACLFDAKMDARRLRRLKNIKWNEVFEKIAMEDGEKTPPQDQ